MRLTKEEGRALGFIAGMILLSVLGRWADRPQPLRADLPPVNVDSLEAVSAAAVPSKGKKPRSPKETDDAARKPAARSTREPAPKPSSLREPTSATAPKKGKTAAAGKEPQPVNINTATAAELDALPGVGPVLAARIVAYRDSVGRFKNVEGLLGVKGVGPAMLEKLRPYARVP